MLKTRNETGNSVLGVHAHHHGFIHVLQLLSRVYTYVLAYVQPGAKTLPTFKQNQEKLYFQAQKQSFFLITIYSGRETHPPGYHWLSVPDLTQPQN